MKQFKESLSDEHAPTEKDKSLVNLIISNLGKPYSDSASALPAMLDCAYKWKDIKIWRDLMERFGENVGVQSENGFVRAVRIFKFNQIRLTYVINILGLKNCYPPDTSLSSGLHL